MREKRNKNATVGIILFHFFGKVKQMKRENKFQAALKKELRQQFPGCIVTKLDSADIQGIPDLLVLYKNMWGFLECKKSAKASKQPNQEYYVEMLNKMSFAKFICPENKEEVLHELCKAFKS